MSRSGARRGGLILTYQCDTHDCDLLGDNFSVDEMHEELVRTVEKEEINDKLRREYRNRIKHIYNFLKEDYSEYYAVGLRKVKDE